MTLLDTAYQSLFEQISPITSHLINRTTDFHSLDEQGRAALQAIKDQSDALVTELENQKAEASRILDDVRRTAAERGISQEAEYFKAKA